MSTSQPAVVVALMATDPTRVAAALEAINGQSAEIQAVFVVGSKADPGAGPVRVSSLRDVVDQAPRHVTHVWLLHDDAVPRPDALAALLREAVRVDASVAGSKLLDSADPELLESVGGATDVFGHPYTGLQPEEVDQQQYDVVRDVAFAPGASMLVRRDLLRGLNGPDPLLEPGAAEIDFSQRARLSGGRVVVVPSSEVLHSGQCRAGVPRWRQTAGRVRSVAKAYQSVTLLWVLPLALLLGTAEAAVRTFVGRPFALVDEARAWLWNLWRTPSLIDSRRSLQRLVGDEELFRYQVGGSAGLRALGNDIAAWSRRRTEAGGGQVGEWVSRSRTIWQTSGFAATVLLLLGLLVGLRSGFLGSLPTAGFALPLALEPSEAVRAVGGGWNPAGLGSALPLHPSVIPQMLLGFVFAAETARLLALAGAVFFGAVGAWRLATALELRPSARLLMSLGLVAGPAVATAMADGYPYPLFAVAVAPFVLLALVKPVSTWRQEVPRVLGVGLGIGVMAWSVPLAVVAMPGAVLVLVLLGVLTWRCMVIVVAGGAIAAGFVGPYLIYVSASQLVGGSWGFWDLTSWLAALLAIGALGGILGVSAERIRLAGAGGLLLAGGVLLGRLAGAGAGREVWATGILLGALGVGLLAGALVGDLGSSERWATRAVHGIATAAVVIAVLASAGPIVWSGRIGLPDHDWAGVLEFTEARSAAHGLDRTLLIGAALPGDVRTVLGTPYRVGARPALDEAWLDAPRAGDRALAEALTMLYEEEVVRPGALLASFGIRWVVISDETIFDDTFASVLDMKRLPIPDATIFENLEPSPIAATPNGVAWSPAGLGFTGPASLQLTLLSNPNLGWQGFEPTAGWAMALDGTSGEVQFEPDPLMSGVARASWILMGIVLIGWIAARRVA